MENTLRYFALNKTSDIVWAHAVNSQEYLERSLADPNIHMLEADILLSHEGQVIMAHPPALQSDLMFSDFIIGVCMHNQIHPERPKGVKLDFKVPVVVDYCLKVLKRLQEEHKLPALMPVWLNADILAGPESTDKVLFDPNQFIKQCTKEFPDAMLSIGWKVAKNEQAVYSNTHIEQMLGITDKARRLGGDNLNVTFPVAVHLVKDSIHNLKRLVESHPNNTITLWCWHPITKELKQWIDENIDSNRTFFDITVQEDTRQ
jgi:hypothetical protein